jgi:endonuclease YncB( thermonuclease family)
MTLGAHRVQGLVGHRGGVFCLVAVVDLSNHPTTSASAPTVSSAASPAAAPVAVPTVSAAPAAAPATGAPAPTGDTVTVTKVIDGDTFVAGGQKVRVLGIDSCEAGTYGGTQATETARTMLDGQEVTLRRQPGIDEDKYGRELRYVDLPGGTDFGDLMVGYDHTGVYQGRNDASPGYAAKLRADDTDGRTCSAPETTTAPTSGSDGGGPSPGDQGLPDGALTGGYCARKWWC